MASQGFAPEHDMFTPMLLEYDAPGLTDSDSEVDAERGSEEEMQVVGEVAEPVVEQCAMGKSIRKI